MVRVNREIYRRLRLDDLLRLSGTLRGRLNSIKLNARYNLANKITQIRAAWCTSLSDNVITYFILFMYDVNVHGEYGGMKSTRIIQDLCLFYLFQLINDTCKRT